MSIPSPSTSTFPSPPTPSGSRVKTSPPPDNPTMCRYEVGIPQEGRRSAAFKNFQRVKMNRQQRLNARLGKAAKKKRNLEEATSSDELPACPICSVKLGGTPEEMNGHVEACLKKSQRESETEPVDVEGETEVFEEYTWAGQTRVRATSMLQGQFEAQGFQVVRSKKENDSDQDLNVDGDDAEEYGKPQHPLRDIIPCTSDEPSENKEREALREAVLGENNEDPSQSGDRSRWANEEGNPTTSNGPTTDSVETTEAGGTKSRWGINAFRGPVSDKVVEALKAKIREQEQLLSKKDRIKCLICMEPYTIPLVSINCWHVHCEECWLRTLGAKKLCPQCNMITAAADLRRIYL
uniref:RING-type domain-containing protein n=1 Tax=Branchiostoma floridae TaxID=7739 RepID=C3YCH7_BRAFL|eukprot:XP_002606004.1 hypothetical protein BRAFLDRAFT_285167 [Branchiostoma floridae]